MAIKKMMNNPQEDGISCIPDDILISIISLLSAAQTARTAFLSKRWLRLCKYVQRLTLYLSLNYRSPDFPPFRFLKKTTINNTHTINDQLIESALSNFPVLEEFCLIGSFSVRNLTINCNNLKKLEILGCRGLRRLGLFTPELVSMKYDGPDIEYVFGKVPRLVEFSFVGRYCYIVVVNAFEQLGPVLEQLVKLNFVLDFPWIDGTPIVSELLGVRELGIEVRVWDSQNLVRLFYNLLLPYPNANVVSLRLFWPENYEVLDTGLDPFYPYDDDDDDDDLYHSVREFELDGFIGNGLEVEVVNILVNVATSLEKVVVRVARRASVESDEDLMDASEREIAMICAREEIIPVLPQATRFELY